MNFDPNDFQDQAELLAVSQRQRQLALQERNLRELEKNGKLLESQRLGNSPARNIPRNRTCPWCGGLLPGRYPKCQNCVSDIIWVENCPYKPEEAKEAREWIEREKLLMEEAVDAESQERCAKENEVVGCQMCGIKMKQKDLVRNMCRPCLKTELEKDQREEKILKILFNPIVIIAILLVVVYVVYKIVFYISSLLLD